MQGPFQMFSSTTRVEEVEGVQLEKQITLSEYSSERYKKKQVCRTEASIINWVYVEFQGFNF